MRVLLLMRGAPGCGKSTWIKEHHLEDYTLSPDKIRVMCSSTSLQPDGSFRITQDRANEQATWEILFKMLEHRMSRGEFTVIDATCSKTKDIQQYSTLCEQYRYRMYIVDFTDIPLETCLKQNKMRDEYKWVPQKAIENIYARFATQKVPNKVKIIKRDELDTLLDKPIDLSHFTRIVFIGDIHGCYSTLMQYDDFKNGLRNDTCYIFLGDFVDRGNENKEVLDFLGKIKDKENVCLLEGNHERWIHAFGNGVPAKSKEFEDKTKLELLKKHYDAKEARMLYRKCRQYSHFMFNGFEFLACHAGIPNLNTNLLYIPSKDFIHGVGNYEDHTTIAESWMSQTKNNQYLVHGHRNTDGTDTKAADRVFNLEGRVEFGGKLRIVELTMDYVMPQYGITEKGDRIPVGCVTTPKWNIVELDDCQPVTKELNTEERRVETVAQAVDYLRNNRFIQEKKLDDEISSFNFTREAFYKGNWNKQTVLARGLFIDVKDFKIMARSYEKFFRIEETHETEMASLKDRLKFPVEVYLKENGFLGIVSYDYRKDDLFIASKSTSNGPYVEYLKKALEPYKQDILKYLKSVYENNPATLVFECEDIENDPHIIKYNKSRVVLLDVIKNDLNYAALSYNNLVEVSRIIKCPIKRKVMELKDWDAFRDLYYNVQSEDYQLNGEYVEGFVFKDQTGFMTKVKTGYYNQWKKLRGVARQTLKCGYITKTGMLTCALDNTFYGFCKDIYTKYYNKDTKEYPFKVDIISLRDRFEKGEK